MDEAINQPGNESGIMTETARQLEMLMNSTGFIAALDQSGGSTPKALMAYGVDQGQYDGEDEMYAKVHEMRTRIMTNENFTSDKILGAILFRKYHGAVRRGQIDVSLSLAGETNHSNPESGQGPGG